LQTQNFLVVILMKQNKIILLCPFFIPNIGGVETHLDSLFKQLIKKKYYVTVLTYIPLTTQNIKYKKTEKSKNYLIKRYWWLNGNYFDKTTSRPLLQFIYVVPKLLIHTIIFSIFNRDKSQTIHAHGFAAGFIGRVVKIIFPNTKLIISTHYIYPKLDKKSFSYKIFKWVFTGADKILSVSQQSFDQMIDIGVKQNNNLIYKHWADKNIYCPDKKLPDKISICYVGRIIESKGVFLLSQIAKKFPQIIFNIIGDGIDFSRLKEVCKTQKNIILHGKKNSQEISKIINKNNFLILPSLDPEGQPMVIMESLMSGTPVIVTNKGSAQEMVNNKVAFVVEPSVNEITKIINKIVTNPKTITQMSSESRKFALRNFSEKNCEIIINSYHD